MTSSQELDEALEEDADRRSGASFGFGATSKVFARRLGDLKHGCPVGVQRSLERLEKRIASRLVVEPCESLCCRQERSPCPITLSPDELGPRLQPPPPRPLDRVAHLRRG